MATNLALQLHVIEPDTDLTYQKKSTYCNDYETVFSCFY